MSKEAFDKINTALKEAVAAKIESVSFEVDGELQTWVRKGHESAEHQLAQARQRIVDLECLLGQAAYILANNELDGDVAAGELLDRINQKRRQRAALADLAAEEKRLGLK